MSGRFFFFSSRRRHTRLQGDWSSDVCSSDLPQRRPLSPWPNRYPTAISPTAARADRVGPIRNETPMSPSSRGSSSAYQRSEEHTSELQSPCNLVCRLLLEKKKKIILYQYKRPRTAP